MSEDEIITNLKAEDYIDFDKIKKEKFEAFIKMQIEYNKSLEKVYRNKTKLVTQEKWKIVYKKAAKEYLPFIVYCIEVASVSIIGIFSLIFIMFNVPIIDDTQLRIYAAIVYVVAIIILCALFFPLLILPNTSLENLWRWFKIHIFRKNP
jgi:hypothetical protein